MLALVIRRRTAPRISRRVWLWFVGASILQGRSLTNAPYKQYMQQHIDLMERAASCTGRRFTLQARCSF
jgi:hypothetical protein